MPIHSIAQALGLSMAAAGRNVDQLVGLHLVERRESASDRRVKLVSLTPGGERLVAQHIEAKHESLRAFTQTLPPEQREQLHRALTDVLAGSVLQPTYRPGALPVTAPAPPLPPVYPEKIDGAVLKIAGVVVLGAIMSILDITVVSVALPTFQSEFDATYATVAWTMTGYTLALATVIPLTGWAADRFGTKRLYMVALVLFTLGSGAVRHGRLIGQLIGFRVLQGLGGGMLMPLGMTIMTRAAGPDRIGRLMAVLGIPMLLGPIGGPILGGWLIDVAELALDLPDQPADRHRRARLRRCWRCPRTSPNPSESFDFLGMLLLSPGLALFLFGVSSMPGEPARSPPPRCWVPMLVGVALVVGFVLLRASAGAPADRPAAVPQPQPDHRDGHAVRVHHRVHGRRAAVPELLPAGARRDHAARRPADGAAGPRRDADHADRRHAGRQDAGRPDGAVRACALIAVGFFVFTQVGADTSYWLLLRRAVRDGPGHGRHDDADHDRRR